MKNSIKLLLSLFVLLYTINAEAQCTLNLSATPNPTICGECVTLTAIGNMDGNVAFQEDFNNGSPTGWDFTQNITIANNTCGVPSPDGSNFMWMGSASVNPRDMSTVDFDLTLGGSICFNMRYAIQGDASPCEGPDLPDEGVYVQYSTDGGATWNTINYWDPNGGNDPGLTSWNQYCFPIPTAAETANTRIRWHQDAVSGAQYDHWGIDDVIITLNDPTSVISWVHDSYTYATGSAGGDNPTQVCLSNDSVFYAQITNGVDTCTDSVTVTIEMPNLIVNADTNSSICLGECVDLAGQSMVMISPGGIETFENASSEFFVLASSVNSDITVQGINIDTINPDLIQQVCINGFNSDGFEMCLDPLGCTCLDGSVVPLFFGCDVPNNESDFELTLTPPGSCTPITLVPSGVATNGNYSNVCFVPIGPSVTSGGFPSSGDWQPDQPFSNLNGCSTNGVWSLSFTDPSGTALSTGTFTGWSITFDNPEISYPTNFTWAPTTNMTNSTTLTPTVCPVTTTTYTLTASDSNNCITLSDSVTITVNPNCCVPDLIIDAVVTNPTCANNDAAIDVTVSNGSGNYTYDWGAAGTSEDLTGISANSYVLSVTDVTGGCGKDTTINISLPESPTIYNVSRIHPTCVGGGNNGEINISVTGGIPPYTYSIDGGTTTQSNSLFTGLSDGTYLIVVADALNCTTTETAVLWPVDSPVITNVTTSPTCLSGSNGQIEIEISGGTAPINYSIDNGTTVQSSNIFTGLSAGTYVITVTDTLSCETSQQITINGSPSFTSNVTQPTCEAGGNDGAITLTNITGGTPPLQYSIDSGATYQTSPNFFNLNGGSYDVMVTDANGCSLSQQVALNTANIVTANFSASPTSGTIPLVVTLTNLSSGAIQYFWDFGDGTTETTENPVHEYTTDGNYIITLTATDANGCSSVFTLEINVYGVSVLIIPNVFTPNTDSQNASFYITTQYISELNVKIYNRWGKLVHEITSVNENWNGKVKSGKDAPEGTYFYILTATADDGTVTEKSGHLMLLR